MFPVPILGTLIWLWRSRRNRRYCCGIRLRLVTDELSASSPYKPGFTQVIVVNVIARDGTRSSYAGENNRCRRTKGRCRCYYKPYYCSYGLESLALFRCPFEASPHSRMIFVADNHVVAMALEENGLLPLTVEADPQPSNRLPSTIVPVKSPSVLFPPP